MSGRRQLMMAGGGVAIPIEEVRGVWWYASSGGPVVSSAMAISGGTVGPFSHGGRGGLMQVYSGGSAVEQVVSSGGVINVSSGGVAIEPIVVSGGTCSVLSGGVVSGGELTELGARLAVSAGGSTVDCITRSYNFVVSVGGVSIRTTLLGVGQLAVTYGGSAYNVTMSGSNLSCYLGGYVSGVENRSGTLRCSGVVEGAVVHHSAVVVSRGVMRSTTVSTVSGAVVVSSGGLVLVASAASGGAYHVRDGGSAIDMHIYEGGFLHVSGGGVVDSAVVTGNGARLLISSGGVASAATFADSGYVNIYSGGVLSGGIASQGGYIYPKDGGVAYTTIVESGGHMTVSSGGSADITTVKSGGYMHILAGGVATNITSETGATVIYH